MKSYSIEGAALLKLLLHAAKHPTSAVNGVLLGTVSPAAGGAAAAGTSPPTSPRAAGAEVSAVVVTDAVPICHTFITLTPVLEAALCQVEQYVKEQQKQQPGLRLVGYYQCNERAGDAELGAGRRIADRLEAAAPNSVAAVLDTAALQAALEVALEQQLQQDLQLQQLVQLFIKDGARGWVKVPPSGPDGSGKGGGLRCPCPQGIAAQLAQYAGEGRHLALCDFEEHLDDISLDWLNPGLLQGPA